MVSLSRPYHISLQIFLKVVFHKFYLVHSWIPWPKFPSVEKKSLYYLRLVQRKAWTQPSTSRYYNKLITSAIFRHRSCYDTHVRNWLESWVNFSKIMDDPYSANKYMLKVNNRNSRKWSEICSKLTIKISERHHRCRSEAFIINFEHIFYLFLVFLLLTLNK